MYVVPIALAEGVQEELVGGVVGLAHAMLSSGICGTRGQTSLWQTVADELHRLYGEWLRGKVPPTMK